jgi:spermidine/putrescine transport system substrate-binding protein
MQRRDVIRMAAWAAGAGTLGRFAAACTPGEGRARSEASGLERELHILLPVGAFDPALLRAFGDETGVRVSVDPYEPRAGAPVPADAGYDLIGIPGAAAGNLATAGRLAPIDRARVPGIERLMPMFRPAGSEIVAIPFAWEATGIAWRPALLPDVPGAAPTTWCVFFEPALARRMTMLDSARDVLGAMLLLRGRSLNASDAAMLQQARDDARACRPMLEGYRPRGATPFMPDDIVVAQARSGDAARAVRADPGIRFAIPREGGPLFAERIGLAASAPHPRAAHAFLDYILRPEISAEIAAGTGRASPLDGGDPALPMERLEPVLDAGEASSLYDRYWMEIKSA